ncbi:class I SAM-dependent methyltransferase [Symbioplanes lichenis]|uniref:class I SAM-dependent methyltransferase n=1 Tax=Symbioplanes lichenis TaxID=1629072 RepID=UPI002739CDA4|nr:class I SAM-dependent methyltransferase [Actinoplanes lichenis]
MTSSRDAAYFDQWYADMAASPVRDAIVARTLGLPPELRFASVLPWPGVAELTSLLRLPADGLLLDIACGRGGYGIEVASRTDARVVGVDFAAVALEHAREIAAARLPAGRASFHVGTLTATGLPDNSADAVMCVDGVQFADPPVAALTEFRRVLRPGGRLALTCWAPADLANDRVPARIRALDLGRDLVEAGFTDVEVHDRPEWLAAERTMYEEAIAVPDPDPAVLSLADEGRRALATWGSMRRVLAAATRPA